MLSDCRLLELSDAVVFTVLCEVRANDKRMLTARAPNCPY